jgi:hypothetical protein
LRAPGTPGRGMRSLRGVVALLLRTDKRNRAVVEKSCANNVSSGHLDDASSVLRSNRRLSFTAFVTVAGLFAAGPAVAGARTYYVSPGGSDSSSGRSPGHAWRTVYRVDKATLKPGDVVLFQGGATFGDQTLMPGWGLSVSGTSKRPVTFGTYGDGKATLPNGIWMKGERHLVFQNFNLGPYEGIGGTGSFDTVQDCTMTNLMGSHELGVNVIGFHWVIRDNWIDHTGDSGMLLRGGRFLVVGNTITNTGMDQRLTYGEHGIYLKAPNSKVIGNTITSFRDDGVSVRYRNSTVKDNKISNGNFGIAYFQGDTRTGTSHFTENTITGSRIAGIYVSPYGIGGTTHENIVIRGNTIYRASGHGAVKAAIASGWKPIALSHNKAHYRIHGNKVI